MALSGSFEVERSVTSGSWPKHLPCLERRSDPVLVSD